jgi:guanine deaminase
MDYAAYMRLAIQKARAGIKRGQTPFGAVIVRRGKVLSRAHNTVWRSLDSTAHAEVNAIRAACKKLNSIDLSGCVIFSTCEPCPMCLSACHWARIKRVVFGARIADAAKSGFNELRISSARLKKMGKTGIQIQGDFLRSECKQLFSFWKKQERSKAY